jgi:hypothetical protein
VIATTMSDENSFYYFLDVDVGSFIIKTEANGEIQSVNVTTIKNELVRVDFLFLLNVKCLTFMMKYLGITHHQTITEEKNS